MIQCLTSAQRGYCSLLYRYFVRGQTTAANRSAGARLNHRVPRRRAFLCLLPAMIGASVATVSGGTLSDDNLILDILTHIMEMPHFGAFLFIALHLHACLSVLPDTLGSNGTDDDNAADYRKNTGDLAYKK
jgi:hypothetical protein